MKNLKRLLLFCLFIIGGLLCSTKAEAFMSSFCTYQNKFELPLPIEIGIAINGDEYANMFSNKKLHTSITKKVYDKESCENGIFVNSYKGKHNEDLYDYEGITYMIRTSYFYTNNGHDSFIDGELIHGVYSIKDTTPPLIFSNLETIQADNEFKLSIDTLKSYLNIQDNVDPNPTLKVTYDSYSNNYKIPGNYVVNYKTCDKDENCSTYTQKIQVKDNTPPIIKGPNKVTSYMSNPLSIYDIKNKLTAFDNVDLDISNKIDLKSTNYKFSNPGIYYAIFDAKDSSNNTLKNGYKVQIEYIDDVAPTIEGPNKFTSYMSNPLSAQSILNNLIAFDNVINNTNNKIYITENNFTKNINKIGTYQIIVNALDEHDNESLPFVIEIINIDDIKPIINGNCLYESYMSKPISILSIKNQLIGFDNVDGNISNNIEIISDDYSENYNKLGTYAICFQLKDSSNNISDIFKIEIKTIDDVLPIIEGINLYKTTTDKQINIDTLTNSLKVKDNVDENIEYKLELNSDNYTKNFNVIGEYYIIYYVCDNSGNISLPFKIKIIVNQTMTFIESINNSQIYLDNKTLKSSDEILNILKVNNNDYKLIKVIEDTYTNNFNKEGNYLLTYEFENTDYTKEYLNININVYKKENNDQENNNDKNTNTSTNVIITKKKKETIFSSIISFFKNLLKRFLNLFKRS